MLELLNNFIITYDEYVLYMQTNFSFVDTSSSLGFAIYILILILFLNIITYVFKFILEIIKVARSLAHRKSMF